MDKFIKVSGKMILDMETDIRNFKMDALTKVNIKMGKFKE